MTTKSPLGLSDSPRSRSFHGIQQPVVASSTASRAATAGARGDPARVALGRRSLGAGTPTGLASSSGSLALLLEELVQDLPQRRDEVAAVHRAAAESQVQPVGLV